MSTIVCVGGSLWPFNHSQRVEVCTCKCDGKTITMQEDGATIVLKK